MPNKIFNSLLDEKILAFTRAFCETSKQTFVDKKGKLIHPGEFGRYRESCCKDFLRYFVPQRLDIEEGFIINPFEEVSTECDVIIYDRNNTPLIQSQEMQKFYPIETVAAVGEIKSILSKAKLKDALGKLSKIKLMRKREITSTFIHRTLTSDFDPVMRPKDGILHLGLDNFSICNCMLRLCYAREQQVF